LTQIRFLADNDLNENIVVGVSRREPAVFFQKLRDIDLGDQPDAKVLDYADRQGLIVVSHDVNTMPAAAYERFDSGKTIAGLLMVKQSNPIALIIDSLLLIWSASELEEWKNQVCFLPING
jgi:hypothetical protein